MKKILLSLALLLFLCGCGHKDVITAEVLYVDNTFALGWLESGAGQGELVTFSAEQLPEEARQSGALVGIDCDDHVMTTWPLQLPPIRSIRLLEVRENHTDALLQALETFPLPQAEFISGNKTLYLHIVDDGFLLPKERSALIYWLTCHTYHGVIIEASHGEADAVLLLELSAADDGALHIGLTLGDETASYRAVYNNGWHTDLLKK